MYTPFICHEKSSFIHYFIFKFVELKEMCVRENRYGTIKEREILKS